MINGAVRYGLILFFVVAASAICIGSEARATSTIPRHVMGGGGLQATSANHTVTTTIGQDAIGPFVSSNHTLNAGFWIAASVPSGAPDAHAGVAAVRLHQPAPSPTRGFSWVSYDLPRTEERVSLKVLDVQGRVVKTLVDEPQEAGHHQVPWLGRDNAGRTVSSGVYFLKLETGGRRVIGKLMVLK